MIFRLLAATALLGLGLSAQPPRSFYPWWDNPVVQDLNLTAEQREKVRSIVRDYRSRLADARAAVIKAEAGLEDALDQETVDEAKANQAARDLAGARQNLTLAFSEMSVKLRSALTADQWKELQKRRSGGPGRQGPGHKQGMRGWQREQP